MSDTALADPAPASIFEVDDPDFAARLAAFEGAAKTREAIIRAALELFATSGYRGTSLRRLAKLVGIEAGSLYNHISSKHELLSDMVLFGTRELLEGVSGLLADAPPDPLDRLRIAVEAHVAFYCIHRRQVRVLDREFHLLEGESAQANSAVRAEYEGLFRKIVFEGIEAGVFRDHDVAVTVKGLLGFGSSVAVWFRPDGRLPAREIAGILAEAAVRGLVAPSALARLAGRTAA